MTDQMRIRLVGDLLAHITTACPDCDEPMEATMPVTFALLDTLRELENYGITTVWDGHQPPGDNPQAP